METGLSRYWLARASFALLVLVCLACPMADNIMADGNGGDPPIPVDTLPDITSVPDSDDSPSIVELSFYLLLNVTLRVI